MKYFIANWKTNKTLQLSIEWMQTFLENYVPNENKKIIICPPFPFISKLNEMISQSAHVYIGSQDISVYEQGTYTGEVSALNLSGIIKYTIIGHSERSLHMHESTDISFQKSKLAHKYGFVQFYCIKNENDPYPPYVEFVCYEAIDAISTGDGKGNNKPLKIIIGLKRKLALQPNTKFIYGGSVNENNCKEYFNSPEIDGFLIGGASLNPQRFLAIINS